MTLTRDDVFAPVGLPVHTYVDRYAEVFQTAVRSLKSRTGAILLISGPLKNGKSTFARKLVEALGTKPIMVAPYRVDPKKGFFDLILDELDAPDSVQRQDSKHRQSSREKSKTLGVDVKFVNAEWGDSVTESVTVGKAVSSRSGRRGLHQVLAALGAKMVLDKLHNVRPKQRAAPARDLCDCVENGLKVIGMSQKDLSDELLSASPELDGYLSKAYLEDWKIEDLQRIGRMGFAALNLTVDDASLVNVADAAHGSPQKMHFLCAELCNDLKIERRIDYGMYVDFRYLRGPGADTVNDHDQKRLQIESRDSVSLSSREFIEQALKGDLPPHTTKIWIGDKPGLAQRLKYPCGRKVFQPVNVEVTSE